MDMYLWFHDYPPEDRVGQKHEGFDTTDEYDLRQARVAENTIGVFAYKRPKLGTDLDKMVEKFAPPRAEYEKLGPIELIKGNGYAAAPMFNTEEANALAALCYRVHGQAGGSLNFESRPEEGSGPKVSGPRFECYAGHSVYEGQPRACGDCKHEFCEDHVNFFVDEWLCNGDERRMNLRLTAIIEAGKRR